MQRVDLSWASVAPQALRWRRLLTLNSLPICLTEGRAVLLFSLMSFTPILYLNSPTSPPHLSSSFPFHFPPSSSYKLSTIFTFSSLLSLPLSRSAHTYHVKCNLHKFIRADVETWTPFCYQCLMLVPVLPVQMAVRGCNPKHCVQLEYVFDLFWLIVMACFCLGGRSWRAVSNRDFIMRLFFRIVLHTEPGLVECWEEERCREDSDETHDPFL